MSEVPIHTSVARAVVAGSVAGDPYRGTSLIRNNPSLRPYSRLMPRALVWS